MLDEERCLGRRNETESDITKSGRLEEQMDRIDDPTSIKEAEDGEMTAAFVTG